MKKLLILISLLFISFIQITNISPICNASDASEFVDDLIKKVDNKKLNIECTNGNCNLKSGIEEAKDIIDGAEQDMTFSEFIQDKVVYILGFISIIATLFIIYAGFVVLTSTGDEEKVKNAKKIIIYVIIGMVIIWSAYSIVLLIINGLNGSAKGGNGIDGGAQVIDYTN